MIEDRRSWPATLCRSLNGSVQPRTVGNKPGSGIFGQVRSHFTSEPVSVPNSNGSKLRLNTVVRGTRRPRASARRSPNTLSPMNSLKEFGHFGIAAKWLGGTSCNSQMIVCSLPKPLRIGCMLNSTLTSGSLGNVGMKPYSVWSKWSWARTSRDSSG